MNNNNLDNNKDPDHIAVFVCTHVFEHTKPVLYVCRDGHELQFLCGELHKSDELPLVVGLRHIITNDDSISNIVNLEDGFEAERDFTGCAWKIRKIQ